MRLVLGSTPLHSYYQRHTWLSRCPLVPRAGWPGRFINVRRGWGLSMVILQLKDLFELFVKRREFLPGSGFLSRRDIYAVESDVKPLHSFLPSIIIHGSKGGVGTTSTLNKTSMIPRPMWWRQPSHKPFGLHEQKIASCSWSIDCVRADLHSLRSRLKVKLLNADSR